MKYNNLIGKSKNEVLELMKGSELNDRFSDEWVIDMKRNFLGMKRLLYLFFENDIVIGAWTVSKNFWRH